MHTQTVQDPQFAGETDALLAMIGDQPPLDAAALAVARQELPDPALAGRPDSRVSIAELYLPLRWGPCRARVYSGPGRGAAPLVLWLHGGGFVGGSARDLDAPCSHLAAAAGCTVESLEYRLAPEDPCPAGVEDAFDAVCWLLDHGTTIGGDGTVAAGGQSAGACLVAAAGLMARYLGRPGAARQVLCYPSLDFGQDTESARLYDGVFLSVKPGRWEETQYLAGQPVTPHAAPLRAPSLAGLPPALVIGAGRDPLRDDARTYAQRLHADGVEVRHVEFDATMHAFLNFYGVLSAGRRAVDLIAEDLRTHLGSAEGP